ncbi:MAG: type II toxin-antitoxin system RelE family toxin [Bacteroidia bacterium]
MIVVATKSFNKDISKIRDKKIVKSLEESIHKIEQANSITEITNVKKMEGADNAFRIRIGNYRLGFYLLNKTIQLTVFVHRKDIYKIFP